MVYYFYGCIGEEYSCKRIIERFSDLKIVHLYNSLYVVPMKYEFLENLNGDNIELLQNYEYLTENLKNTLINLSKDCFFAYLEATYFGGSGDKIAIIFKDCEIINEYSGDDAFNVVLKDFGINKKKSYDEFEEVGFG